MAVAIDSVSDGGTANGVASKTWTHTSSGINRAIVVAVEWNQPSNSETVSSVTYDGVGLTQLGTTVIAGGSGLNRCVALYQLKGQAVGAKTVVVTMSTSLAFFASAISYVGVDQTSPFGTPVTSSSTTSSSISATVTATTGSLVLSAAAIRATSATTTPTASQWNVLIGTNNRFAGAVQTGSSSVTATYSWTTSDNAALIAVQIRPATSLSVAGRASLTGSDIATLVDDFATKSTLKWQNAGGGDWPAGISVVGGQLNLALSSTYVTLESVAIYDLRNSAAYVQIVQLAGQGPDHSTEFGFGVHLDANNYFVALINGSGSIIWRTKNAGTAGTTGYTTYDATAMRWLRWRHSGATVFLEVAPNGSGPWATLASYPMTFSLAMIRPYFYGGMYGTVTTPGTAIFDNFNTLGSTKTVAGVARLVATVTKSISGSARLIQASGFGVGGLAFPGNPIKILQGHARLIGTGTKAVSGKANLVLRADTSVRPTVGSAAEELYARLGPYNQEDSANGWALLRLCEAICSGLQWTEDLVRDTDEAIGWSSVLDLDRAPDEALPWLAQFVGVDLPSDLDPDTRRLRIRETAGFQRGSVTAIRGAARQYLTGNRTVVVEERDTSPYHLTVRTFRAETPDETLVDAALQAQKPAGLVLVLRVSTGATYGALKATGMTYGDLAAAYPSYEAMKLAILA